jgi:hypothetical protein
MHPYQQQQSELKKFNKIEKVYMHLLSIFFLDYSNISFFFVAGFSYFGNYFFNLLSTQCTDQVKSIEFKSSIRFSVNLFFL